MNHNLPSIDDEVIEGLKDLADEDDPDFLRDLVEEYLKDTQGSIQKLRNAIESRDSESVVKLAHTLKGASGNLGAIRMASISRHIEELGFENNPAAAITIVDELAAEFDKIQTILPEKID